MQRKTIRLNAAVNIPSGQVAAIVTPEGAIFVQLFSVEEREHVITPEGISKAISLAEERKQLGNEYAVMEAKRQDAEAVARQVAKDMEKHAANEIDLAAKRHEAKTASAATPTFEESMDEHDEESDVYSDVSIIERIGDCETLAELRVIGSEVGFDEEATAKRLDIKRWKEPRYRELLLEFIDEKNFVDSEELEEQYRDQAALEAADVAATPKHQLVEDILNGLLDDNISYEKALMRLNAIEGLIAGNNKAVVDKFMDDESMTVADAATAILTTPTVTTSKRGRVEAATRKFVSVEDAHTLPKGIRIKAELYDGDGTVTLTGHILTNAEVAQYEKDGILDNVSDTIAYAYWEDDTASEIVESLIKGNIEVI